MWIEEKTQWEYEVLLLHFSFTYSFKQTFLHIFSIIWFGIFCGLSEVHSWATVFFTKSQPRRHIYANSILIQHQLPWLSISTPSWISVLFLLPLSHHILSMSPQQTGLLFTTTSETQLISSPDGGPARHSLPQMHIFSPSSLHFYINCAFFKHLQHLPSKLIHK